MLYPVLITDLDNTLYNWDDYFAPSFRAMVHFLSKETGIDEDVIFSDYRYVYREHDSIEFSKSTQELAFLRDYSSSRREKLAKTAAIVFGQTGRVYLHPYEGVLETLSWAVRVGIKLICVTNAPLVIAENRLQRLKMSGYFSGLAGYLTDWKETEFRGRSKKRIYWGLQKEELNSKRVAYEKIAGTLKLSPKSMYIIGDNLEKDVEPAIDLGAIGIWAKYGKECKPKSLETIRKISTLKKGEVNVEKKHAVPKKAIVVDKFKEIKKIIHQPPQITLEGFELD